MDNISPIIEKVQKLLALAKSSNAGEAANAAAAANKLIDQYRLSVADLEYKGQAEEPVEEDQSFIYETGKVTRWKVELIDALVKHYGLYVWNDADWSSGRMYTRYRLVGRKSDITIAKYLYSWLSVECQRLVGLYANGQSSSRSAGRIYVASYCDGFVAGIKHQLAVSRSEVQKDSTSEALVKINARCGLSKDYAHSIHKLSESKSYSRHRVNKEAFTNGEISGKNIHLGASMNAVSSKLLGK
jgi:hypothetical protein